MEGWLDLGGGTRTRNRVVHATASAFTDYATTRPYRLVVIILKKILVAWME